MRNILTNIRTSQVAEATEMLLSYNATTSLNILIETASGDDWEIDWGDGVWEQYVSSDSIDRTKTFGSATAGVVKVRSATGRGLSDLHRVESYVGTWSFDVADLCATYIAYFEGNSMTLTGNVGDIKATYDAYFQGNSMALTGNVGDIKATYSAYFYGNSMALTGDVGDIKATYSAHFQGVLMALTGDVGDIKASYYANFTGSSMELTYTTKTWTNIPIYTFLLNLASGHLTTSELSQMLIDMDDSGITGSATLDFRYNNGGPNAAGEIAADNLRGKGYNVLTNTSAPTYEAETIDYMTAIGIPNDSATYYSTLKNSDVWNIIDDYVKAEKANGSFQFFDYPMIGNTATQHSYNLVDTSKFQITWSGSWTHSELGAKGNGSNTYGKTGFVPSDEQDVYSNGLSYVSGTDLNEIKSTVMVIGQAVDSNSTGLTIQVNKPSIRTMMNGNSILGSVSTNSGVVTSVRQSNTVTKIFKDGSQLASGNSGGSLPSYEVFLGTYGRRGTAVVNSCSIQRFQSFKAHIGLTDTQVIQHHANIDAREAALLRKTW